jgi:dihydrofolate reductase
MASLSYSAITSLDGYVADSDGVFDWSAPDEEVHRYVNDLERGIGLYLYGRRMYEVMSVWEDADEFIGSSAAMADYARLWQAADKVVFSHTVATVSTARTRIERAFDPAQITAWKAAADADISVGGPQLAAQAIRADLVDDLHLFLVPEVVGGGNRALPDDVRLSLELVDERRFGNGTVHLHYRRRSHVR